MSYKMSFIVVVDGAGGGGVNEQSNIDNSKLQETEDLVELYTFSRNRKLEL